MTCYAVGSSYGFLPQTGGTPNASNLFYLVGSSLYLMPVLYQIISQWVRVLPRSWPSPWRPPIFMVEGLIACFFLAAIVLQGYMSARWVQLGMLLWLPGSLLCFYVPYELLRQKMEEAEEADLDADLPPVQMFRRLFSTEVSDSLRPAMNPNAVGHRG